MAKSYKIKRYRHIYKRRRFSPVKAVLLLLLLAALIFVGFSLYEPVRDFWNGKLLQRMESSSLSESEEAAPPLPQQPSEEAPEPPSKPEAAPVSGVHAVHIPEEVLLSGRAVSYLEELSLPDINTALIDLKNETGQVLYQSHVEFVAEAKSQHEQAVDLAATIEALQAAGYQTAGRLCAFRDTIAPYAHETAAVKYENTNWTWLDNTQEAGGNPWLNPYSPVAQDYISDLAHEAAGMGIRLLFVDYIQFPDGLGRDRATFGEWAATQTQEETLRTFSESLRERLLNQGTAVVPCMSGIQLLGQKLTLPYNDVNPAKIFTGPVSVKMMPAIFGEVFEAEGGFRLQAPATTPFETVRAVAGKVLATVSEETTVVPWLQGYTEQRLSTAANKTYTQEDIEAQIQATTEAGLDSYIIEY